MGHVEMRTTTNGWIQMTLAPLAALVAALTSGGCATTVTPPPSPQDPVAVYLAVYGKHSTLMVERETGRITEFGYTSWSWEVDKRDWWLAALPTLIVPNDGALCVNERPGPLEETRVRAHSDVIELVPVRVSRAALRRLLEKLDAVCTAGGENNVLDAPTGWVFVKDEHPYWVMHTCNDAVAVWLRELGCQVQGPAVYSNFEVKTGR
jgi:hypothetical protein